MNAKPKTQTDPTRLLDAIARNEHEARSQRAKAGWVKRRKRTAKPKLVLQVYRQTCSVHITQHGPKKFVWRAQQSWTYFSEDGPQPGDLNEQGEAKTLEEAAQAAFDALFDHLDIE